MNNQNITPFAEGLSKINQDLLSKYKENFEGFYSDLEILRHEPTQCSICNTKQGIVSDGFGSKGIRNFITIDKGKVSYFICRQCLKDYNLLEQ